MDASRALGQTQNHRFASDLRLTAHFDSPEHNIILPNDRKYNNNKPGEHYSPDRIENYLSITGRIGDWNRMVDKCSSDGQRHSIPLLTQYLIAECLD